ncbi:dnaJ homolog subfamily C member 30, mitochondrial [Schistocerca cancellata]|uniref:dnaJ homolog subfamily C member 30, mitochondrial n=1 Tax=Schistocerca cancellata TaxID=274614 RepID=UPI002119A696|nr:dnaJ homolog subfamily C member 30, mitochondrial [Schistocerca cancellata]
MYLLRATKFGGHLHPKRFFTSSPQRMKSHYDALGLTPKATQSDIKNAYYKLSMVYHPDKNKGSEEASQKFRDITTAYEVLGNLKLRKLYDKGILHTAGPQYASAGTVDVADDPEAKFYKSRMHRAKPPAPTGRTPIYDFDEWTQAHYGETFARKQKDKAKYEARLQREAFFSHDKQHEVIFYSLVLGVAAFMYVLKAQDAEKYDVVKERKKAVTPDNTSSS